MSRGWRYSSGDWNAVCDSCGKKLKASELTKRWDGLMVCKDDYEPRHQQDFLRARKDKISVPWTRPVQDTFITAPYSVYETVSASDAVTYSLSKGKTDQVTISDSSVWSVDKVFSDSVLVADSLTISWFENISETVTSSDTIAIQFLSGYSISSYAVSNNTLG